MSRTTDKIERFDFLPGRSIAGKYTVESRLGGGWEGEVYKVIENKTGIQRAAKLFYPQRNPRDRTVTIYARKLDRLRRCSIVIDYHHWETIRHRGTPITCLISDYVTGELFNHFVARHPGRRLHPFEALHLLYTLVQGLEEIHALREYHGDLHEENVLVERRGIYFDVKLVDFYHWGRSTSAFLRDDVVFAVRLLYESVGGRRRYADQPAEIKAICRGLRKDLIIRAFPTARALRQHLETFRWEDAGR